MSGESAANSAPCQSVHPILGDWGCVTWPMRCDLRAGHDGRHEHRVSSTQTVVWGGPDA